MPLFEAWDVSRTKRKFVVANSLDELTRKGKGFECVVLQSPAQLVERRIELIQG